MTTTARTARAPRALYPLAMVGVLSTLAVAPSAAFADDTVTTTAAPPAFTATGPTGAFTAKYAGEGVGYNKVLNGHAAGTVKLLIEDRDTIEAFCIQYAADIATTGDYTSKSYTASGVNQVAKAADIAVRHNAIAGALSDPRAENAAAQLAIWKLTDNEAFAKVPNAAIVARAQALVAAAQANTEAPSSLVLTATAEVEGKGDKAKDTVEATVKTAEGTPVAGKVLTFTVGTQSLTATTDATGNASVTVDAPDKAADMSISFDAVAAAGTVLVPAGKQAMVTTADAKVTRSGTVSLPAEPTVTITDEPTTIPNPPGTDKPHPTNHPNPEPTPPAPPTINPKEDKPTALPHTGGWATTGMLAGALGLAGAGFAGRRFLRRR